MLPTLTADVADSLCRARDSGLTEYSCSLDLGRSLVTVRLGPDDWSVGEAAYPYPRPKSLKDRSVYYWSGTGFEVISRYHQALIKLVPTRWGPPTFEIDGIKMLPTQQVCPYADAQRKVGLIEPQGKRVLDTCGGLGYFAAWCLALSCTRVVSYEKNETVLWLRTLNPWSPPLGGALELVHGDIALAVAGMAEASFDAILHDPPRFGIAGELYSRVFYDELARVLRRRGQLFHYTGSPNRLTSGRDVPQEVSVRLQKAGFSTRLEGDGILAVRR